MVLTPFNNYKKPKRYPENGTHEKNWCHLPRSFNYFFYFPLHLLEKKTKSSQPNGRENFWKKILKMAFCSELSHRHEATLVLHALTNFSMTLKKLKIFAPAKALKQFIIIHPWMTISPWIHWNPLGDISFFLFLFHLNNFIFGLAVFYFPRALVDMNPWMPRPDKTIVHIIVTQLMMICFMTSYLG